MDVTALLPLLHSVLLGLCLAVLLAIAFMLRRQGATLRQLATQQASSQPTSQPQANLLLLEPSQGNDPLTLLNFSEAAVQLRRIARSHLGNSDSISLLHNQASDLSPEQALLAPQASMKLHLFSGITPHYPDTRKRIAVGNKVVLAKITITIHYFYEPLGNVPQETRFAVTHHGTKQADGWLESLEIKRYS